MPVLKGFFRAARSGGQRSLGTGSLVSFGMRNGMALVAFMGSGTFSPVVSMPSNAVCSSPALSHKCLVGIFPSTRGVAPSGAAS